MVRLKNFFKLFIACYVLSYSLQNAEAMNQPPDDNRQGGWKKKNPLPQLETIALIEDHLKNYPNKGCSSNTNSPDKLVEFKKSFKNDLIESFNDNFDSLDDVTQFICEANRVIAQRCYIEDAVWSVLGILQFSPEERTQFNDTFMENVPLIAMPSGAMIRYVGDLDCRERSEFLASYQRALIFIDKERLKDDEGQFLPDELYPEKYHNCLRRNFLVTGYLFEYFKEAILSLKVFPFHTTDEIHEILCRYTERESIVQIVKACVEDPVLSHFRIPRHIYILQLLRIGIAIEGSTDTFHEVLSGIPNVENRERVWLAFYDCILNRNITSDSFVEIPSLCLRIQQLLPIENESEKWPYLCKILYILNNFRDNHIQNIAYLEEILKKTSDVKYRIKILDSYYQLAASVGFDSMNLTYAFLYAFINLEKVLDSRERFEKVNAENLKYYNHEDSFSEDMYDDT